MKIPPRPPTYSELVDADFSKREIESWQKILRAGIGATIDGRYRHYSKLQHLEPPAGLGHEEWWFGIKIAREKLWRDIPLLDKSGTPFRVAMPDEAWAKVHEIDRNASGNIEVSEEVVNPDTRDRYIFSSLIEEAVTSSQLEGAATTTPVAKEMLRSGRKPRDEFERMIVNNYLAMQAIRSQLAEPLTPERVLSIHKVMTEGTLRDPSAAGRLRTHSEYRVVADETDGTILHEPPPAFELPERMERMCQFANADSEVGFMHPVVRAVLLHFWLAYDHPFVDGNGRTARALFYWQMLSQGYWLCEFISISRVLRRQPAKYARSFLYSESDENDTTYFLLSQLEVTIRAIRDLHVYVRKKATEIRRVESMLRRASEFNHRQLAVLSHALRHPGAQYTIRSHQRSHNIVYETARTDLLNLVERNLLTERKRGRTYIFRPCEDLPKRLESDGA